MIFKAIGNDINAYVEKSITKSFNNLKVLDQIEGPLLGCREDCRLDFVSVTKVNTQFLAKLGNEDLIFLQTFH